MRGTFFWKSCKDTPKWTYLFILSKWKWADFRHVQQQQKKQYSNAIIFKIKYSFLSELLVLQNKECSTIILTLNICEGTQFILQCQDGSVVYILTNLFWLRKNLP